MTLLLVLVPTSFSLPQDFSFSLFSFASFVIVLVAFNSAVFHGFNTLCQDVKRLIQPGRNVQGRGGPK